MENCLGFWVKQRESPHRRGMECVLGFFPAQSQTLHKPGMQAPACNPKANLEYIVRICLKINLEGWQHNSSGRVTASKCENLSSSYTTTTTKKKKNKKKKTKKLGE
jgi:hypothetical protein